MQKKFKNNWFVISIIFYSICFFYVQEFDIKLLTSIVQGNEETRLKQSEQQHKFRRDALKLLKQFEQQMKLEKEKEQEFDIMYQ